MSLYDNGRTVVPIETSPRWRGVSGSLTDLSATTRAEVQRLAEDCGVDQSSIVRMALEALFEKYESDDELALAIRLDRATSSS